MTFANYVFLFRAKLSRLCYSMRLSLWSNLLLWVHTQKLFRNVEHIRDWWCANRGASERWRGPLYVEHELRRWGRKRWNDQNKDAARRWRGKYLCGWRKWWVFVISIPNQNCGKLALLRFKERASLSQKLSLWQRCSKLMLKWADDADRHRQTIGTVTYKLTWFDWSRAAAHASERTSAVKSISCVTGGSDTFFYIFRLQLRRWRWRRPDFHRQWRALYIPRGNVYHGRPGRNCSEGRVGNSLYHFQRPPQGSCQENAEGYWFDWVSFCL